jgi:hypothetical protein
MSGVQNELVGDDCRTADGSNSDSTVVEPLNVSQQPPSPQTSASSNESIGQPKSSDGGGISYNSHPRFFSRRQNDVPKTKDSIVREDLLEQFYATLRATYLSAEQPTVNTREIHERICARLDGEHTWGGAYEIEQLLTFILTEEQLATEVGRRMGEAEALDLPFVSRLAKQLGEANAVLTDKARDQAAEARAWRTIRYVLHRLLNDLQWFYQQRIHRRDAAMRLSLRVSALFFTALAYFFALLFVQFFAHHLGPANVGGEPGSQSVERPISDGAAKPANRLRSGAPRTSRDVAFFDRLGA